jgi:hypothetical protein
MQLKPIFDTFFGHLCAKPLILLAAKMRWSQNVVPRFGVIFLD